MEQRINDVLTREVEQMLQVRDQSLLSRIGTLIDNQGKDIATDFSSIDR